MLHGERQPGSEGWSQDWLRGIWFFLVVDYNIRAEAGGVQGCEVAGPQACQLFNRWLWEAERDGVYVYYLSDIFVIWMDCKQ